MYELNVQDMTCGHCAGRVTRAIQSVDARATLEIDVKHRRVRINSSSALTDLLDAMAAAGYPATPYSS